MNKTLTAKFGIRDRQAAFVLTMLVLALVVMNLAQDFLSSALKKSAFYFSEALIFSSFWWLFALLLYAQYFAVKHKNKKRLAFQVAVIVLPIFLHLFGFPLLVWVLSKAFYYHTYSYLQTFRYTLSEHLYLVASFYSIPVLVLNFITKRAKQVEPVAETQDEGLVNQFLSTIIVSDGNRKSSIKVAEIFYFSANSPYIDIHVEGKKYLQHETLKAIYVNLNPEQFIRVHKSTIVNIEMVASYTTRLNGDYDITMKNNVQLRVSRNFAADFKNSFNKTHRLTTK